MPPLNGSEHPLLLLLSHDARDILEEIVASFLAPEDSAAILVTCSSLARLAHETWNTKLFLLTGKRKANTTTTKELKKQFRQEFFLVREKKDRACKAAL
jgi:hypothetical protein